MKKLKDEDSKNEKIKKLDNAKENVETGILKDTQNIAELNIRQQSNAVIVQKRSEILFIYDIQDNNPNGDPLDSDNKPRIDEETDINIVTDVRKKRTIRDYIHDEYEGIEGKEIFIREIREEDGKLKTKLDRIEDLQIHSREDLTKKCIDIRFFGCTTAIKGKTITCTGPIQLKIGRSMHKVTPKFIKGTTVMHSEEKTGKKIPTQGTFTGRYILPYSLIKFYGIINENAAKETGLTEDDVKIFLESIWNGTKNLISQSKVGQMPRLLLKINYKDKNYHIGDIDNMIKISSDLRDEEFRDISQVKLDMTELINNLITNKTKILDIEYKVDGRVKTVYKEEEKKFEELLSKVEVPISIIDV